MQNQQNVYKPKASGLIWFGSIAIGFAILALELYGAWMGFPFSTAVVLTIVATLVCLWGIFLTKYHDEPGEKFTMISAVCKIVLLIATGTAGVLLFNVAREISVAQEVTTARAGADDKKRDALKDVSKKAGPKGQLQVAKGLSNMDTSYVEKPMEVFKEKEGVANAALILNGASFTLTFIAMFLAFIFAKTNKMVAAENGYNPNLVVNPIEQHRLSEVRFRSESPVVASAAVKADPGKPPAIDANNVKRGVVIDGWECVMDPGVDGRDWGNKWEYVGDAGKPAPSLPSAREQIQANNPGDPKAVERAERRVATQPEKGHLVSRHDDAKVATQSPGVATRFDENGVEKVRQALREYYASPGHYHFKVEPRSSKVLIRQMSYAARGGQEKQIHGAATNLTLINWAAKPENTIQKIADALAPWLEKNGFDLEYQAKRA